MRKHAVLQNLGTVEIKGYVHNYDLVNHLLECSYTDTDVYFVFLDYVLDNAAVVGYIDIVSKLAERHKNLIFVPLLCFEYLLLRSQLITEWFRCPRPSKGFSNAVLARQAFLEYMSRQYAYPVLEDTVLASYLCFCFGVKDKSELYGKHITTETLATLILHSLAGNLSEGFRIQKTVWGECWTCECCVFGSKVPCELRRLCLTANQKAILLYTHTDAKRYLEGE